MVKPKKSKPKVTKDPKSSKTRPKSSIKPEEIGGTSTGTSLLRPVVLKHLARVAQLPPLPRIQKQDTRPPPAPKKSQGKDVTIGKSSSKIQYPASLAAAMLSLPWPPPETFEKVVSRRLKEEDAKRRMEMEEAKFQGENDYKNGNVEESLGGGCCGGKQGPCQCSHKGKGCCSLKNSKSSKSCPKSKESLSNNNRPSSNDPTKGRLPGGSYKPLTVPSFDQVHSAWPGFEHPPIQNWKRKYMTAKPWRFHYPHQIRNDIKFHTESGSFLSRPTAQVDVRAGNLSTQSLSTINDFSEVNLASPRGGFQDGSQFRPSRLQIEHLS